MHIRRALHGAVFASSLLVLTSCQTAPPPAPVVRPAAFVPLGVSAPYLSADVIGGRQARSGKMRAAKIRPLSPAAAGTFMGGLDQELRQQTAGIGLDVLNLGSRIAVRIPGPFTFEAGNAAGEAPTPGAVLG